jgi:L-serine dehydratase
MAVSTFDVFKIGIGPSSSHTVGPMKAAERFIHRWLLDPGRLHEVARIRADVYGSLALTGRGHGTDKAILLGLEGQRPNLIDPDIIPATLERIRSSKRIQLMGQHFSFSNISWAMLRPLRAASARKACCRAD